MERYPHDPNPNLEKAGKIINRQSLEVVFQILSNAITASALGHPSELNDLYWMEEIWLER